MANKKLRLDTITILLEVLYYFNPKTIWNSTTTMEQYYLNPKTIWRVGGRGGSGNGVWQQKQLNLKDPPPRTPKPIIPAVCEKNIFCFIHSSASGKPHF